MGQDGGAAARCRAALETASRAVAAEWDAARRSAPPYWVEGIPPRLVQTLDELGAAQKALRETEGRVAGPARAPRPRARTTSSGSPFPGSLPLWGS